MIIYETDKVLVEQGVFIGRRCDDYPTYTKYKVHHKEEDFAFTCNYLPVLEEESLLRELMDYKESRS